MHLIGMWGFEWPLYVVCLWSGYMWMDTPSMFGVGDGWVGEVGLQRLRHRGTNAALVRSLVGSQTNIHVFTDGGLLGYASCRLPLCNDLGVAALSHMHDFFFCFASSSIIATKTAQPDKVTHNKRFTEPAN